MKRTENKKHKIRTYEINKISLSCFDGKGFFLDDGIHTQAYFHKDLRKQILSNKNKWAQMIINLKDENRF